MIQLLSNFSAHEVLMFIVMLAIAFKSVVDFIDWLKGKINTHDDKTQEEYNSSQKDEEWRQKVETQMNEFSKTLSYLTTTVDLLKASDKDAIKSYITEKHHFFCYQKKWIDDYTLDCLERRYQHYVEENGNSFIKSLMAELRELPKEPPLDDSEEDEGT